MKNVYEKPLLKIYEYVNETPILLLSGQLNLGIYEETDESVDWSNLFKK